MNDINMMIYSFFLFETHSELPKGGHKHIVTHLLVVAGWVDFGELIGLVGLVT